MPIVCLVGAYAITGRILTDASLEVASLKRAMIRSARRAILLVDSTKFRGPVLLHLLRYLSDLGSHHR